MNTLAAEVLYTVIQDWAQLDVGSTVLDVCCGTGTIGLALARVRPPAREAALAPPRLHCHLSHDPVTPRSSPCRPLVRPRKGGVGTCWSVPFSSPQKVKRVVGIELCQEAVEDARANARDNGEGRHATPEGRP